MGLLLVLRAPQPRPKSLRRATRGRRRERHRADADEWATAQERGLLLDVPVEKLRPAVTDFRSWVSSTRGQMAYSFVRICRSSTLTSTVWGRRRLTTRSVDWWRR
ncbi:hypothetical protein ACWD8I_15565 [Micromonospora arida]|uniref:hypothetical protein n=1 Tax=Micromonospora arida TaxID=2203715 RepID=UPI00367EC413